MSTILVIEDNADLLENTCEILQLASHKVICASGGEEGVKLLKKYKDRISLILCDINMSDVNGFDVLLELKKKSLLRKISFVFMSAKCEKSDIEKASKFGVNDFLIKPFNRQDLLSVVKKNIKNNIN